MRQKRVLVYAEAPAASPTFQIRIAAPLDAAGIEIIYVDDLKSRELIDVVRTDVDAVIVHRGTRKRCKVYTILREAARKYDKPLIYDVDDLLIHVPRTHPHYQVYQSRAMGAMRTLVNADLVIASTSVLADYLRHFHANVLTIPNRLPELLWRSARQQSKEAVPARHRDSQITLGYVGTASHLPDLQSIQGALTTVLERYHDRVRFVAVGVPLPSALGSHPLVTCITPPRALRSNYAAFAAFSARLPIDVGIAPLIDTPFNCCKSDIKFQEYAALSIPGVFSNLPPYCRGIVDGCNGFLARDEREWVNKLGRLIESADLRHAIAAASLQDLQRHWQSKEPAAAWNRALDLASQVVQTSAHQRKRDGISAVVDELVSYQNDLQRQLKRTIGYQLARTFERLRRKAS